MHYFKVIFIYLIDGINQLRAIHFWQFNGTLSWPQFIAFHVRTTLRKIIALTVYLNVREGEWLRFYLRRPQRSRPQLDKNLGWVVIRLRWWLNWFIIERFELLYVASFIIWGYVWRFWYIFSRCLVRSFLYRFFSFIRLYFVLVGYSFFVIYSFYMFFIHFIFSLKLELQYDAWKFFVALDNLWFKYAYQDGNAGLLNSFLVMGVDNIICDNDQLMPIVGLWNMHGDLRIFDSFFLFSTFKCFY